MTRIEQAGQVMANNFISLGLPVTFVKGVEHIMGDTLYFNLEDMADYNEAHIKNLLQKIAVFCHEDMTFGKTKEAHFKVEWKYDRGSVLSLLSILDVHKVVIGKDTDNKIIDIDFDKTPHLLVAGTTGSGKSVLLKTLFCSLFYHYCSPNASRFKNCSFIIIDPKGTEFNMFRNVVEYVDETPQAIRTLKEVEEIMDYRYANNRMNDADLYVIIDELADLMLTSRFEVEQSIVRIAQKGRACGIHLIVASQRPSVDVVSGLIKANMSARLILKVASVRDSVVCMDRKGAEELTGNGDCIFKNGLEEKHFKVAYPDVDIINRIVDIKR